MKVIVFASVKGGVGKTAAAVFTSQVLSEQGAKVTFIDGDPNNCATDYFLRDISVEDIALHSLYHALNGTKNLADCVMHSAGGISIVPATPALSRIGLELAHDPGIAIRFPKAVKGLSTDVVVIDTPPSLTLELTLALHAADIVIVPVGANRWTVGAFPVVADMVRTAADATGRRPLLLALPAIVSAKENDRLRRIDSWSITKAAVLKSSAIRNALNAGNPLKAKSLAWNWYADLVKELTT